MEKKKYRELKMELVKALDSTLEKQVEKLEKAVQKILVTGDYPGDVELLLEAGLVKYLGNNSSLFFSDHYFEATLKGFEVYKKIQNFGSEIKK